MSPPNIPIALGIWAKEQTQGQRTSRMLRSRGTSGQGGWGNEMEMGGWALEGEAQRERRGEARELPGDSSFPRTRSEDSRGKVFYRVS